MLSAAALQPPMKLAGNGEQLAEIPPAQSWPLAGLVPPSPSHFSPSGFLLSLLGPDRVLFL